MEILEKKVPPLSKILPENSNVYHRELIQRRRVQGGSIQLNSLKTHPGDRFNAIRLRSRSQGQARWMLCAESGVCRRWLDLVCRWIDLV